MSHQFSSWWKLSEDFLITLDSLPFLRVVGSIVFTGNISVLAFCHLVCGVTVKKSKIESNESSKANIFLEIWCLPQIFLWTLNQKFESNKSFWKNFFIPNFEIPQIFLKSFGATIYPKMKNWIKKVILKRLLNTQINFSSPTSQCQKKLNNGQNQNSHQRYRECPS